MTQPPETQPRQGSGLSQKMGPLPAWGWIAIAAAGGIGVLLWLQNRKNAAAAANTTPVVDVQGADAATVQNLADELQTVMAQIRDLQSTPTTTGTGTPPPSPTPRPVPVPTPRPVPQPVGPPGGIGPPGTPPPKPIGGGRNVGHTTVIDGKSLQELLSFFNMTSAEFEALNPGISSTYRSYIAGRGYVPAGTPGSKTVLNVGTQPRVVQVYGGW